MTFLHKITQIFLSNNFQKTSGISQQPTVVKPKTLAELEQEIAAQAQLSNTPQKKTHNKAKRGILTSCTWKYECQNHNYVQGEQGV